MALVPELMQKLGLVVVPKFTKDALSEVLPPHKPILLKVPVKLILRANCISY